MLASTDTTRGRETSCREKAPRDGRRPRLLQIGALHGSRSTQTRPRDPFRKYRWDRNQQARRGTKATGTSEVGSHRITEDKNSSTGWTDSPKWAWRRETLGSSITSAKRRKSYSGCGLPGRRPVIETRSLREQSNTGARVIRVCEWQLLVVRITCVQRSRGQSRH